MKHGGWGKVLKLDVTDIRYIRIMRKKMQLKRVWVTVVYWWRLEMKRRKRLRMEVCFEKVRMSDVGGQGNVV